MTELSDGTPAGTLESTEAIFRALEDAGPLDLTEIADRTGLPASCARTLLDQLVRLRWLAQHEQTYDLGSRLSDLGTQTLRDHWFHHAALPCLQDLHRRTGLVVHLGLLDGGDTVFWERLAGDIGVRVPTRVGGRHPAYRTAVGKAMLSRLPATTLDDASLARPGRRAGAQIDDDLRTELSNVAVEGIAFDRAESVDGIGCVAAPIDYALPAPTAVSVCGPAIRVLNDRKLVAAVQQTAAEIAANAKRNAPTIMP